jgi:hypothetical protein
MNSVGLDGTERPFEKPLTTTFFMFAAMAIAMPVYLIHQVGMMMMMMIMNMMIMPLLPLTLGCVPGLAVLDPAPHQADHLPSGKLTKLT